MERTDNLANHPLYRAHTIDSAMDSLWSFYKNRFLSLFTISLIMSLVLQYLSTFINLPEIQSLVDINDKIDKMKELALPMLVFSLVSLLFTTILQYYVIFNPLDREKNIFRCIPAALKYYLPYIIVLIFLSIAGSVAIFFGLLLLVIGVIFAAVYVFMLYLFILPVMMSEGPNIGHAMVSTVKLAHSGFWSNIAWTAVFVILFLVISVVLSGLILLPFTGSMFKAFSNPEEAASLVEITSKPLYIILSAIVSALTFPLVPIFAAIMYFNARAKKESGPIFVEPQDDFHSVKVEDLYAKPLPENEKNENDLI